MKNVCTETFDTPLLQWLARPYFDWWSNDAALRALEHATGGPWWLIGGAAFIMFAAWTACYVVIFKQCRRDETYGFPIVNVALNLGWEAVFAFALLGPLPRFYFPLQWGHLLWVVFDLFNVYLIFKFGRGVQQSTFTRRYFYPIVIATFALAMPACFVFIQYTRDVMGVSSAMIIDVVMAALFINLFANRLNLSGLSYAGGWFRLVGDVASFVFLFLWWPAQFESGVFATCQADAYLNVPEPRSYLFLNAMYVSATILDVLYIGLLTVRRRELRRAHAASTSM
jgi:hypothetical protein